MDSHWTNTNPNWHFPESTRGGIWATGAILKSNYGPTTPAFLLYLTGILEGIGVGCGFQPVLVGLLAGTDHADRAVIIGLRNFIRDMGGSIGITVSGAIFNNVLKAGFENRVSSEILSQLTTSAFSLLYRKLSPEERELILKVYVCGLDCVFITFAVLTVLMFVGSLYLRNLIMVSSGKFNLE